MTQDRTETARPLFADMDDDDDEATGTMPLSEPGKAAGVDPLSVGTPGAAAIPLGAPTSIKEPLEGSGPDDRSGS